MDCTSSSLQSGFISLLLAFSGTPSLQLDETGHAAFLLYGTNNLAHIGCFAYAGLWQSRTSTKARRVVPSPVLKLVSCIGGLQVNIGA